MICVQKMRMKREEHHIVYRTILMYSSGGGGGGPEQIFFLVLDKFFEHVKKILNFQISASIKVAKFKLDHLGFYCKPSLCLLEY